MDDITLIYYSANLIEDRFATNIRNHLLSLFPEGISIVSVTHKPIDFGKNICVAGFEVSIYNIYRQILIGSYEAKTPFLACCEDDALYNLEHFSYRPADDTFAYNYRWLVNRDCYFYRYRANMCMCIAPTELMINTLETRFKKYPSTMTPEEMGAIGGFGEPGRLELKTGLPYVKMEVFTQAHPTLTFNHRPSMGGVRKATHKERIETELPFWGKASDLWHRMYDGNG